MNLTFQPDPVPLRMDEHGAVRVEGSRVLLEVLLGYFKQGESPESLAANFPTIPLAAVYAIIAYYLHHKEEVEDYLRKRHEEAEALRRTVEANQKGRRPSRAELVARLAKKGNDHAPPGE